MQTAIDLLHANPSHVQSTVGCDDCRTWARVVAGYSPSPYIHPDCYCGACKTPEADTLADVIRLHDYVDTRA